MNAANISALRFRVNIIGVRRIRKNPEAVSAEKVLPAIVGYPARILRVTNPRAVVLQSSKNVIRIRLIHADVIKLRNRQVVALPPRISAVVGIPDSTVITCNQMIGIFRIHPYIVKVPMGRATDDAETL